MDISETYIKMCEKAWEIQMLWKPKDGDFLIATEDYEQVEGDDWPVVDIKKGEVNTIHSAWRMDDDRKEPSRKAIWLPRQDDLQGMVGGINSLYKFWDYVNRLPKLNLPSDVCVFLTHCPNYENTKELIEKTLAGECNGVTSMEQLWLAFVMKEKFGKQWVNGEWISEKKTE